MLGELVGRHPDFCINILDRAAQLDTQIGSIDVGPKQRLKSFFCEFFRQYQFQQPGLQRELPQRGLKHQAVFWRLAFQ
ncbi:hypothetical protein D9M71_639580 [compost metagenome]